MKFGIDRLLADKALRQPLAGRRVALLAHPASLTEDLAHSLDANFRLRADERHAFAVACKAVARPFARGREIEFVVSRTRGLGDEQLAACVLPELVGDARRARRRDAHAVEIALQPVFDLQAAIAVAGHQGLDAAQRGAGTRGMTLERCGRHVARNLSCVP